MCRVSKCLATKNKQRNKNLNFWRTIVHWKPPKRCHYTKLETISIWKHIIQPLLIQSQDRMMVKLVASSEAFRSISFLDSFPHDPMFTSWFLLKLIYQDTLVSSQKTNKQTKIVVVQSILFLYSLSLPGGGGTTVDKERMEWERMVVQFGIV